MADFDPRILLFMSNEEAELLWFYKTLVADDVPKTFNNKEHLKYMKFDLAVLSEQECKSRFRFSKEDIPRLLAALGIPQVMHSGNGTKWTAEEGLCILLRRLNYPKRYEDMVHEFGRHPTDIGIIFNNMIYFVWEHWGQLLSSFDQPWLQEDNLRHMAQAINDKGCPMDNCYGFIDGKIVPNARPVYFQKEFYNGKDKLHGLKYQSLTVANGLIANLYGPVEGRRHDSTLLRESRILEAIANFTSLDGNPLVIYGDKAYPLHQNLITPFRGVGLTGVQTVFNTLMNSNRITVEWDFAKVNSNFAFVNYRPNLKVFLQPVALYYKVAVLLSNCHTCFYGNQVSKYFDMQPITVEEYLQ